MDVRVSNFSVLLIATASFVIVVAGMRAAAALINPFLLAVFLAVLFSPPLFWLQRRGVPNALAVSVILLGFLAVAFFLMVFVGRSLNSLSDQLPAYQERLASMMTQLFAWLSSLGVDMTKLPLGDYVTPRKVFWGIFL